MRLRWALVDGSMQMNQFVLVAVGLLGTVGARADVINELLEVQGRRDFGARNYNHCVFEGSLALAVGHAPLVSVYLVPDDQSLPLKPIGYQLFGRSPKNAVDAVDGQEYTIKFAHEEMTTSGLQLCKRHQFRIVYSR